jgi:hypothetical protein
VSGWGGEVGFACFKPVSLGQSPQSGMVCGGPGITGSFLFPFGWCWGVFGEHA